MNYYRAFESQDTRFEPPNPFNVRFYQRISIVAKTKSALCHKTVLRPRTLGLLRLIIITKVCLWL